MKGNYAKEKTNRIIKKLVFMAVIVTMLAGDFILPIKLFSIAKELEEKIYATQSETSNTNDKSNNEDNENSIGDNGKKEEKKQEYETEENANINQSEESNQNGDEKPDEENLANSKSSNSENSNNELLNNELSNIEPLNNDSSDNDVSKVNEESTIEEPNNNQEPSVKLRGVPVNLLNTNNSLSLQNFNSEAENFEKTPEELDRNLKATSKEIIDERKQNNTYKIKNDLYEIRKFETDILSGAKKDSNGNYVWTATSAVSGHEFTFRVNYELSGYRDLPAGALKITIPKSILRNREDVLDDHYDMSLPTLKECKEEGYIAELIYKEDGDYLVIYNPDKLDSGTNGYFEISYATNSATYNYRDYNPSNIESVKLGGTASDGFYAILELNVDKDVANSENNENTEKDILNNITEDKNVFINTNAELQSTQKRYPTIFRDWNLSWMEQEPADKDDYYYLVWEITSYIGDITQKYSFSLEDFVTNLTDGTAPEDYEILGYKLAGERYYSNKNKGENQTLTGYRYDYVLTRHKKSKFGGKSYKLKNNVTAKVHPIDGVDSDSEAFSSNIFSWDNEFKKPTGNFNIVKYGNNTGFGGKYANYDLDKLQSRAVSSLNNFKYQTQTIGYAYPWTLRDGGDSGIPADYGVNNVNYETWDDTLYLEEDENPLNTDDYYLEYFTYSISNQDAEFDDFYNKFNTISPVYADDEIITFYAKFGDRVDGEGNKIDYEPIGTYNLKTKEVNVLSDKVQEMTTSKVKFKEEVQANAWKFTTSNKHYYTGITVIPYYVLTNSNYVMEKINNKDVIKVKNIVNTKITDHNDNVILEKDEDAYDYARVTYYNSDISKTVSAVANKKARRQYTITWKINVWETATSGEGIAEYIQQESGTFYDIVPLGGDINVNSIQVQTEKGFLPENEYSYKLITNYKNSGRTMLIVRIDEKADYYNIYYTTVHSWASMKDYGKDVLNPIGFETGNEKITNGYPDDGGNLSEENRKLFNDLNEATDDKKFLYTERNYNISLITAAMPGLQKKVKNTKDEDYQYNTEVEPGESYAYRLRFENTYLNYAKNLIFFDSIENFKVVDEEAGTEKVSGWHGTLKGIDLSQIKRKGIDAKVYVSTIENLDLEEYNDLEDTSVWSILTEQMDLSIVKALAIDMTKKDDGEDFILNQGDSVSVIIYMQAPENSTQEMEQSQYAYANVYMQNTLINDLGETVDYFIHQDYTNVKYHVVADIPMQKINAQNIEEGIKGITFRLYGTSFYGNNVDEYITSAQNGYITFKSIEAGNYILQEYSGNRDWIENHTEHNVTINVDKTILVDGNVISKENILKIANTPRAHTDVIVYKKDLVNKTKSVEGAKFKLSGTSDYGNEILMYAVSDSSGRVFFEDIEKGKYDLTEVSTVEGYTLNEYNKETFILIVDENSNYNVEKVVNEEPNEYESTYVNGRYEIYNEPLHVFTFMKKDLVDINKGVKGVSFKITGTSDYGNYFEKTAISDDSGKVTFEELEKGTYKLWETETIKDYVLNTDTYTVQIDKMGDFTITEDHMPGEENKHIANIDGKYRIYNEPKHSFYFIKKDSYNNEKLGNAKFKLCGSSNNGNVYDEEAISTDDTGAVEFTNLESGTYFLKEIEAPNTNEVSFVLDEEERIIEVSEDGKITLNGELIWPLEERNENEPYVWFNTRNKGQITITKKWVDNLSNDQRKEPKIYISTLNNEEAYSKVYFRTAYNSHSIIDYVTYDNVTAFKRNVTLTEQEVTSKPGVERLDNNFENDAKYKIYAWNENGTVYWWTKADRAVLPTNLYYYFQNEAGLTDISWTGIYRNGYWQGTVGNEEITTSITNMQNMFYGCTSMENLDISWFNNSGITVAANMQYAFGNNGGSQEGSMTALKYITVGNNFKLFDTSILPKGKWKNQNTEEQKENTELIGNLTGGTYEWSEIKGLPIGTKVSYSTTLNGVELNDWSVFYNEGDYTYIILDGYLPNSAVNISGIEKYRTYSIYSDINREHLIEALNTKSNWEELVNNGKINGTDLSSDVKNDTNVWAMGSPTLDLWVNSYNKSYPENMVYTAKNNEINDSIGWGYYIGTEENPTSMDTYLYNGLDPLYHPPTPNWRICAGYWIASPSAGGVYDVVTVEWQR